MCFKTETFLSIKQRCGLWFGLFDLVNLKMFDLKNIWEIARSKEIDIDYDFFRFL